MSNSTSLAGHFLIAMPGLDDSYFAESLVYVMQHDADGAMGIVVNQPGELSLANIIEQLEPEELVPVLCHQVPVFSGGPVQMENGFVLHSNELSFQHSKTMSQLTLTTSRDILFAIAEQRGPKNHLIALGYAGWGAGQLDDELKHNTWLTCPAQEQIIFSNDSASKRNAAISSLGINPMQLSQDVGHS